MICTKICACLQVWKTEIAGINGKTADGRIPVTAAYHVRNSFNMRWVAYFCICAAFAYYKFFLVFKANNYKTKSPEIERFCSFSGLFHMVDSEELESPTFRTSSGSSTS